MGEPRLRALSFGGGVQSTTVLLMAMAGELPGLDAAVFADTGWEPPGVYEHVARVRELAGAAGIPVSVVSAGNLREEGLRAVMGGRASGGERHVSLPYYTRQADGSMGQVRRQCTQEYKIRPIQKELRRLLGSGPRKRLPEGAVELWIGISLDEVVRMKESRDRWIVNRWPLVDRRMSRHDCLRWLQARGYPTPPRSACIGCPFHSAAEWRRVRQDPELWRDAVEFDAAIRKQGGRRGDLFVHRSCVPLGEVDLSTPEEQGQAVLWEGFAGECEGMCGV